MLGGLINSWVVVGCVGRLVFVGKAGVCGGIVEGKVCFVHYAFFTIKKCIST